MLFADWFVTCRPCSELLHFTGTRGSHQLDPLLLPCSRLHCITECILSFRGLIYTKASTGFKTACSAAVRVTFDAVIVGSGHVVALQWSDCIF